jgi:hypothetical protein
MDLLIQNLTVFCGSISEAINPGANPSVSIGTRTSHMSLSERPFRSLPGGSV